MNFLLHMLLHKRQTSPPLKRNRFSREKALRMQLQKESSAHAASQELLHTAALKGNRRVRKRNPPHTETERSP